MRANFNLHVSKFLLQSFKLAKVITGSHVSFQTAWSTPEPVIIALSKHVPYLIITCDYADEDTGNNVGSYSYADGKVVYKENLSGTEEGLIKALLILQENVKGALKYIDEMIVEYSAETDAGSLEYVTQLKKAQETLLAKTLQEEKV